MTTLRDIPLFAALADSKRILVAGAGGGFDVYGGLPLAFALRSAGAEVFLGNQSFSPLDLLPLEDWLVPDVAVVTPASGDVAEYFPERTLACWLERNGQPSTVYAFPQAGVQPLRKAYAALVDALGLDAIVLVDGGTDILMRGDEDGLGTPAEDMTSLAAVAGLGNVPVRLVVSIGFGIDAYHGVNHVQVLENLADLEMDGAYLGAFSVPRTSPEGRLYLDAVADAQEATPIRPSIVHGQIAAAMLGVCGDVHFTERTRNSTLFVNPLMAMYFAVTVEGLAGRHQYLDRLERTVTIRQVSHVIEQFRRDVDRRAPRAFPH
jgi:hypothetical protein